MSVINQIQILEEKGIINKIHDSITNLQPRLSFIAKSHLGNASTLLNASHATNFIYEITGPGIDKVDINKVNNVLDEPKITSRINFLFSKGLNIEFADIQSKNLKLNLQLIDSNLPEILSYLLLYRYTESKSLLRDLLKIIEEKNPLNFDTEFNHPFYEYKIKNFLTDSALGMTPGRTWTGQYDATGGIIIVKEDGELVCYHIYNRNEFQEYLVNNTRLEQAGTTRYEFGELYEEGDRKLIKLNLQVRFN